MVSEIIIMVFKDAPKSLPHNLFVQIFQCQLPQEEVREGRSFNPDEFVGIPHDHPASYRAAMRRTLFEQLELAERRCHIPDRGGPFRGRRYW